MSDFSKYMGFANVKPGNLSFGNTKKFFKSFVLRTGFKN